MPLNKLEYPKGTDSTCKISLSGFGEEGFFSFFLFFFLVMVAILDSSLT